MENRKLYYHEEPVVIEEETLRSCVRNYSNETCICCGAEIPEGRQICPRCENDTYRHAIRHYGREEQTVVAIEEMAELTKELSKNYRGKENREAIAEEVADVEIMLEQLKRIFGIPDLVNQYKCIKLARLQKRIDEENKQFDLR